jgi:hypothetical protein
VTASDRKRLHAIMAKLIAHASQLDYPLHDVRGKLDAQTFALTWQQAVHRLDNGGRLMFDCSQAVTNICKWAGVKDPSGYAFKRAGYTGSMLAHLTHYANPKRARIGALVVFGPATGEHVAMVYETDKTNGDPLLFSHGARWLTGPIRLHREKRFHDPPVTFLDVSGL